MNDHENDAPSALAGRGIEGLCAALAKAQAEFPDIPRSRNVTVKMRSGGNYQFAYAPLDAVIALTRPVLAANGLAVTQLLGDDGTGDTLTTMLTHAGGGFLTSKVKVRTTESGPQSFGSALTYMRRYAYQCIVGVATETDDDGNTADGNTADVRERSHAAPPAPVTPQVVPQARQPTPIGRKATPVGLARMEALGDAIRAMGVYTEAMTEEERRAAVYAWSSRILDRPVIDWKEVTLLEFAKLEDAARLKIK